MGYLHLQLLTQPEVMRSQFATASQKKRNSVTTPFAFTEHGVTMLESVLKSERAAQVNIAIVRAFIALRQLAMNYKEIEKKIEILEDKYDMQFLDIYEMLQKLIGESGKKKNWEERAMIGYKNKEEKE